MRVSKLYPKVAKELGISEDRVREIYQAYWKFYLDKVRELPLKDGMTQEDFNGLKSGFHIQKIGKFYCNYKTYTRVMKVKEKITKKYNKNVKDNED